METIRRASFLTFDQIKQRCLPAPPKVPDEFRKHKQEYLFLRGINIECFGVYSKYHEDASNVFDTPQCRRLESFLKKFLLAQEFGYLGDLSGVHFNFVSINKISEMLDDFMDQNVEEGVPESALRFESVYAQFLEKSKCAVTLSESDLERDFLLETELESEGESEGESDGEGEVDYEIVLPDSDSDSDSD